MDGDVDEIHNEFPWIAHGLLPCNLSFAKTVALRLYLTLQRSETTFTNKTRINNVVFLGCVKAKMQMFWKVWLWEIIIQFYWKHWGPKLVSSHSTQKGEIGIATFHLDLYHCFQTLHRGWRPENEEQGVKAHMQKTHSESVGHRDFFYTLFHCRITDYT